MPGGQFGAPTHERANRRGRGIEDVHAIFVNDGPEAVAVRIIRRALIHQRSRAIRQRTIHDIGMAGDPADIRGAPVDIFFLDIENVAVRRGDAHQISGGSVHDTFGFASCAAGVENEEHVFGIHGFGGALIGGGVGDLVPPDVAARLHGSLGGIANPADHHHALNCGRAPQRLVYARFQRHDTAAAPGAIAGDHHFGLGIIDTFAQGLGRKSTEDDAVRRADFRASEHGDGQFRHHAHVNGHAVAFGHAERTQRIGETVDFAFQHPISEYARIAGLAFPDDCRFIPARGMGVPIHAVVSDI